MQLTKNLKKKTKGLKTKAEGLERPLRHYILVIGVITAVLGAGAYAITVPDSVENDYFMRGDQHNVNGQSSYRLDLNQSSTAQNFTRTESGDWGQNPSDGYWGVRVFRVEKEGQEVELTSGSPEAIVSRSGNNVPSEGLQTAQWTPPETNLGPDDALVVRVYQSIGSGSWQQAASFSTERLNASKLNSETWDINYYTRLYDPGSAWDQEHTGATFYWGTSTYNSGIQGLNYSLARLESEQISPNSEKETWPGQSFTQSVQLTCRASTCEDIQITPKACQGRVCSNYREASEISGLSWDRSSVNTSLVRGETLDEEFNVEALEEGDYRIRFDIEASNIPAEDTGSELIDVSEADVTLSNLEHPNQVENGLDEYEVGDTIDYLNTTVKSRDEYSYWLAGTGSPSVAKIENGSSTDLGSRPEAPTNGIYSGDANDKAYYIGAGNGNLKKWNGSFTDIPTPTTDTINSLSVNSTHMFFGTGNPEGYIMDLETKETNAVGITGSTPVSASNSYGADIGGDYFLVGTGNPSVLKIESGEVTDVRPSFIQDTVHALAKNSTHFLMGDISGNVGLYNGTGSRDISDLMGLEGNYAIKSAEWGGFIQDGEPNNFWLIGGGSGRLIKYYPNGTTEDLSGALPGSWQVEEITYSEETQEFYIGGSNGNVYSYSIEGFTDRTPGIFAENTGLVQEISYTDAGGGKAFDVTVSPSIASQEGRVSWSPDSTRSCGNLSRGEECERGFDSFQIPEDAETGEYNFEIGYDWMNFGPETNSSSGFRVVNVRDTVNTSIGADPLFYGQSTDYNISIRNKWSESIENVEVSINCPPELGCSQSQDIANSLGSGNVGKASYTVEAPEGIDTGLYEVNATLTYDNPSGETKNWSPVGEETFKVATDALLITTIESEVPERIVRGENLDINGSLKNNNETANDIWLNYTLPQGWNTDSSSKLLETVDTGEKRWNNITADIQLAANKGEQTFYLNSSGVRGDYDRAEIEIFSQTSLNLDLNSTELVHGSMLRADAVLEEDTGNLVSGQKIIFKENMTGERIGTATTDQQGEASIQVEVPTSWEAGTHEIVATYERNESIYTSSSNDTTQLVIHDRPNISEIKAKPLFTGLGRPVQLNATVFDGDGVKDVSALIQHPSGTTKVLDMKNSSSAPDNFSVVFETGWENGRYDYRINATDEAGFETVSSTESFTLSSNSSANIVTGQDAYGPYSEVDLERSTPVTRNSSESFWTLTSEQFIDYIFADSFAATTGTATLVSNTQEQDGEYFTMTQNDGGWENGANFEGVYTYNTGLENIQELSLQSYGNVTGATWNIEIRNYDTESWEGFATATSTTPAWTNETACTTGCGSYVSNGEIQIRVTSSTGWYYDSVNSYDVDFQQLTIRGENGPVDENEKPSQSVTVGEQDLDKQRYSSQYSLEDLPHMESGDIQSATLYVDVASGSGTGEIYHVENFDSGTENSSIHRSQRPQESTQTNPINTFGSTQGLKQIDVTQAVSESFESGKDKFAFQVREENEDQTIELNRPLVLAVNHTSESEIVNTGSTGIRGGLSMEVQSRNSGSWETVNLVRPYTSGSYTLESGEALSLSSIWSSSGGFNTGVYSPGEYRVLSRMTDSDGETLVSDTGTPIRDTYSFRIGESELRLSEISHENWDGSSLNEYGVGDIMDWINLSISNSEYEAAEASADLQVLDNIGNPVSWGPNSEKMFGDISVGETAERRWDNGDAGYEIPTDASSGTFSFRWGAVLDAANADQRVNNSLTFQVHDVPGNFSSQILDSDNRILRNESTVYNFSVYNPWSRGLDNVNITINCNASLSCESMSGSDAKYQLNSISPGSTGEASFNISTNQFTPTENFDINATVTYRNPGGEEKTWEGYENEILQVRRPGSFLNVTYSPDRVVRSRSGYEFRSFANNTYSTSLDNHVITWRIPETWSNATGSLEVTEETHETGELVWNNFTATVGSDSGLGEKRINISTDNEQGRVDDDFVYIDVYSATDLQLDINQTDPAADETVNLEAILQYQNGTPIAEQPVTFTDQRTGNSIGTVYTDGSGQAELDYNAERPYGDHRINASYPGSENLYALPANTQQNITVRDRPNITDFSVNPQTLGFGYNSTVNASVTDREGLSDVELRVTYPNLTERTFGMANLTGDNYSYSFGDTWQYGTYNVEVIATDVGGKTGYEASSFSVDLSQASSIRTTEEEYSPDSDVNITDYQAAWWDRGWDYRRRVQVNETSGNNLVDYPVELTLTNLGENTNNCQDLRFVENGELRDYYVASCNPFGDTVVYVSTNVSASATEENLYAYYGNSEASEYNQETYAYRITDSGSYTSSQDNMEQVYSYNDGDSIFRYVDITFEQGINSYTVYGYNINEGSYTEIGSGTGSQFTETFYENPRFNRIRVETQGDAWTDQPSITYDFTTPLQASAGPVDTQDLLPSLIENTGETEFQGRVFLEVTRNNSGSWETVSTRYNQSTPTEFQTEESFDFANVWNDDPWNTNRNPSGYYRAVFKLLSPSGEVLTGANGEIKQTDTFKLNSPSSDVNTENIEIYNVTGGNMQTSTSDLEDEGLNKTFSVYGGGYYRFDIGVSNAESAEANWSIDSDTGIYHEGLNSSWNVNSSDIFYRTPENQYSGGSFSGGEVSWNTQGGQLSPGENATFSYIVQVPNNDSLRDIMFTVNDTTFLETDDSELDVIKEETQPPNPVGFDLNTTSVIRGEGVKAYANWSETIGSAIAEYNQTTSTLVNTTFEPSGTWTNHSFSTSPEWARGRHAIRLYADDLSGNTGKTVQAYFNVYGNASLSASKLNTTRIETDEYTRLSCRVTSNSDDPISNYNVTFYNEDNTLGSNTTNSTGWASLNYSSQELGYERVFCGIQPDESRYYKVGDDLRDEEVRIVEEEPPEYESFELNSSRIFKTRQNDTVEFTSKWTDNHSLNMAALVEGNSTAGDLTIPEPQLRRQPLSGEDDWANFTLDLRDTYPLKDTNLTVFANDNSSNVNGTPAQDLEIWAWGLIEGQFNSGENIGRGAEATYSCRVTQGNDTALDNYDVTFYDNSTESGEWRELGTNITRNVSGTEGVATWSKAYSESGNYDWKCNISSNQEKNIEPLRGEGSDIDTLTVTTGDVEPPVIINENYGINTSELYKGFGSVKSFAQWNESVDYSYVEYGKEGNYSTEKVEEPYTDQWTNFTLDVGENWSVGTHEIKTYANDSNGNLNDTLQYQEFDVYGRSEVGWVAPTGTVERGVNEISCGVYDAQNSEPIESYQVTFLDDSNNVIGSNQTGSDGEAVYSYNSSGESTGEKTWSCQIQNEPDMYYNISSNNTASEQINLVEERNASISGNLTRPVDGTTLAQNKTFTANVSVKCSEGGCGDVEATLRYNSSGLEPDTPVSESSGTPFHTVGSNTKTCSSMEVGEICNLTYEVNATGEQNQEYSLDAQLTSPEADTNDTENKDVSIDVVLITDFEYSEVSFPDAVPNETVSAPGNSGGSYSFTLTENSNDAAGAWIRMTNLTSSTSDYELRPQNTVWTLRGDSCGSADGGNSMTHSYSPLLESLEAGTTVTQCYWQHIPFGKREGIYQGTISIKVNATE